MFVNTTSHLISIKTKNNEIIHVHPDPKHQIHCHYVEGQELSLRNDINIKEYGHWKISETFNKFTDYPEGTIILTSQLIGVQLKERFIEGFKTRMFDNENIYVGSYNTDSNEILIYF